MSSIRIETLPAEQLERAIALLARAFVTNPIHVAAFGPDRLDHNETFFRIGLNTMKGRKVVASDGERILGAAHWALSHQCQFSALDKVRTLPAMLRAFRPRTAARVLSWVSAWSAHDPAEPHCHLGPIGVDSDAQGQGVGSLLMQEYCADVDRVDVPGFLETDRPENVAFYERFGFTVTETARVLGVETWFMRRPRPQR
jgi:ribosomal protein S18 acetylase RimI-like enzyme